MAWTFSLSRHQGQTMLVLEDMPLPWMIIEEVAAVALLPHSWAYRLANKMILAADSRRRRITQIRLDPATEAEIDPDWDSIWSDSAEGRDDR